MKMARAASTKLQVGMISANIDIYSERIKAAVAAVCQYYSQQGATYAKENKPWTTRTGDAKKFLHGKVVSGNKSIRARISHGVYYGIYLEKKYSGKYGVLPKVLRRYEGEFLEDIQRIGGSKK